MSGELTTTLEATAGTLVGHLGRAAWQGGLALALAWSACRLLPRLPPSVRCWLWRLAYLKLIVAFVWTAPVELPVLPAPSIVPSPASWRERPAATIALPQAAHEPVRRPKHRSSPLPLYSALVAAWLVGVVWSAVQLLRRWRRIPRLRRQSAEVSLVPLLECCRQSCRQLGIRRPPRLLHSAAIGSPVLIGGWRPAVLIPEPMLATWRQEELELVLAHELAHLKQRDLLWAWLPALAAVLFWFHPLVRVTQREWRLAQEMACDAMAVLLTGAPTLVYGEVVLKVAAQHRLPGLSEPAAVGAAGAYQSLRQRLAALPAIRPHTPRAWRAAAVTLALIGVVGVVPWRVTAQPVPPPPSRVASNHQSRLAELEHQRRLAAERALAAHQRRVAELEHQQRLARQAHARRLAELEHRRRLDAREHERRRAEQEHAARLAAQAHEQRLAARQVESLRAQVSAERQRIDRLRQQIQSERSRPATPQKESGRYEGYRGQGGPPSGYGGSPGRPADQAKVLQALARRERVLGDLLRELQRRENHQKRELIWQKHHQSKVERSIRQITLQLQQLRDQQRALELQQRRLQQELRRQQEVQRLHRNQTGKRK